ncbi:MAG: DUF1161 domain-containing protein [Acidobacteria bacterium]|nr:DUF1161 domain-containing protein [Acidobacteriota bacterium]
MRKLIVLFALAAFAIPAAAQKRSCDELKAEIEAKLKTKGVAKYALDIVPAGEAKDAKEVGSCDGGAKRIVYKRG